MSYTALQAAFSIEAPSPRAKLVLLHLANRHDPDSGDCAATFAELAAESQISGPNCRSVIRELTAAKLVEGLDRYDGEATKPVGKTWILEFLPQEHRERNRAFAERLSEYFPDPEPEKIPMQGLLFPSLAKEQKPVKVKPPRLAGQDRLEEMVGEGVAQLWIDHRKKIGSPMTEGAYAVLIKQFGILVERNFDPQAVIEHAVMSGWRGVKAEWIDRRLNTRPATGNGKNWSALDQLKFEGRAPLAQGETMAMIRARHAMQFGAGR